MAIDAYFEFTGSLEGDDLDRRDPVMRLIRQWMVELGWQASEFGEDHGCVTLDCSRDLVRLEFMCTDVGKTECGLQIHPQYTPGLIGWLRGKQASATEDDIYAVAVELHERVSAHPEFHNPRWCWNGFPDDRNATPRPTRGCG